MSKTELVQNENRAPLIDFDDWAKLAKSDPDAFEAQRKKAIEEMIQRMPEHRQQRIRCLQWKVDQVRSRSSTPMAACIRISEMMWDSLVGEGGLRDALAQLGSEPSQPLPRAAVLQLRHTRQP
jgi:hypothetical protein